MGGRTAIGLDIGTSVVRAVELSLGRGGLTLERFEDNPQLEGDQIDDTLPIDETPRFFAVHETRVGTTGVPAWKMRP